MSKTMRTRNLDPVKPMVIFDATKEELPDRIENPAIVRTNTNLPTGMEKEEETEHHLQLAMTASQTTGDTKSAAIPIPPILNVERKKFDKLYPKGYTKDSDLYRVQGLSAGPEPDVVDYCADETDDTWVRQQPPSIGISIDRFEFAMDRLEKHTGAQILKEEDAVKLFGERTEFVTRVYDYWLSKRHRLKHPLISRVRTETRRDSASGHDPYVAFRRRAEKMQTRKNRKSDEQNFILMHKMKVSHTQLMKDGLMEILQKVRQRELLKLRVSILEREEFQLSSMLLDDHAGDFCSHIINNYPELSRLEAETCYEPDQENEEDEDYASGEEKDNESVTGMSDISDSDSLASDESWGDVRPPGRHDRRIHSPDLEGDTRHAVPVINDPNYVPEAQYRGEDPPDYWTDDREFTFAPRRDCKYFLDTPPASEEDELDLTGFSLQDIPVVVEGQTIMQTVYGRRVAGRNGMKLFEYYPLPDNLSGLDLQQFLAHPEAFAAEPQLSFLHAEKTNMFVHSPETIANSFPVDEDGSRFLMPPELLDQLYQFIQTFPVVGDATTVGEVGEEEDVYQIACDSVAPPFLEHNYCQPRIPSPTAHRMHQEAIQADLYAQQNHMDDGSSAETSSTTETLGEVEAASAAAAAKDAGSPQLSLLLSQPTETTPTVAPLIPLAKPKPAPRKTKPKVEKTVLAPLTTTQQLLLEANKPLGSPNIVSASPLKRPLENGDVKKGTKKQRLNAAAVPAAVKSGLATVVETGSGGSGTTTPTVVGVPSKSYQLNHAGIASVAKAPAKRKMVVTPARTEAPAVGSVAEGLMVNGVVDGPAAKKTKATKPLMVASPLPPKIITVSSTPNATLTTTSLGTTTYLTSMPLSTTSSTTVTMAPRLITTTPQMSMVAPNTTFSNVRILPATNGGTAVNGMLVNLGPRPHAATPTQITRVNSAVSTPQTSALQHLLQNPTEKMPSSSSSSTPTVTSSVGVNGFHPNNVTPLLITAQPQKL